MSKQNITKYIYTNIYDMLKDILSDNNKIVVNEITFSKLDDIRIILEMHDNVSSTNILRILFQMFCINEKKYNDFYNAFSNIIGKKYEYAIKIFNKIFCLPSHGYYSSYDPVQELSNNRSVYSYRYNECNIIGLNSGNIVLSFYN